MIDLQASDLRSFVPAMDFSLSNEPYGALVTYAWDPSGVLIDLAQWPRPENI